MNKSSMHTKMPKLHDAVRLQIKKAFALLVAVIFMGLTMWSNRSHELGNLFFVYSSIFTNVIVICINYLCIKKNNAVKICAVVNIAFLVDLCYVLWLSLLTDRLFIIINVVIPYIIINFLVSLISSILYRM